MSKTAATFDMVQQSAILTLKECDPVEGCIFKRLSIFQQMTTKKFGQNVEDEYLLRWPFYSTWTQSSKEK